MERLLQYLSTHSNNGIRYYASNMQLQVQSDASYLCRPRSRSVSGGLFYLGTRKAINGSIACTSKMLSCIVASAAEAESAAGFQQAQIAVRLRNTLTDLGYPQLPTLLLIDNTVPIELANDTINKKRSKSMDMRFFWLCDTEKEDSREGSEWRTRATAGGGTERMLLPFRTPFNISSSKLANFIFKSDVLG